MRDIKFRGKRREGSQWVYGDLNHHNPHHGVSIVTTGVVNNAVTPETVGQFTGLKDKNGVEIYEGDVVMCSQLGQKMKGLVVFGKGMWCWRYDKTQDSYLYEAVKRWNGTVVGNIHDNPELELLK